IQTLDVLHREPYQTSQLVNVPRRIDDLKRQLAGAKDAAARQMIQQQLKVAQEGFEQLKEIKPTAPNVTYSTKTVLDLGGREVQLLFLGRGHTNGDTVVFLPKEKIVATGDLMESQIAYMGDAQFDEWVTTLEALKKLDFATVLPGHGMPFKGKALITAFQGYLSDFTRQGADLRKQGVTADAAAQRVDLTAYRTSFPQIQGPAVELRGMQRMYQWMDERAKK